ncbi:hypothetical protein [Methylocystis echinoides]|uniref:Uncharacterized protein n=1 Tax=Methylocystis echinoides TaxID=29468 RepID=A0A9W6GRX4_9HYPH|nr:hypothetical protein [Methylocystis echinoides]GLI91789.1 hypothetical protein LMG27198_07810 [Methylocystis echinoides]
MDNNLGGGLPVAGPKRLSGRDLLIFAAAIAGVVFFNVGVVRALDVALDAFTR